MKIYKKHPAFPSDQRPYIGHKQNNKTLKDEKKMAF